MKTNAKFTSDTCLKTGAVANTNALSQQLTATNSTQMLAWLAKFNTDAVKV